MNHCRGCGLLTYNKDSVCWECTAEFVKDWEFDGDKRYPIGGLDIDVRGNGGFLFPGREW